MTHFTRTPICQATQVARAECGLSLASMHATNDPAKVDCEDCVESLFFRIPKIIRRKHPVFARGQPLGTCGQPLGIYIARDGFLAAYAEAKASGAFDVPLPIG